ncbi:MAG: HEAT repeat domain-containing protein [Desulfatibacillaceae bacterium]
MQEKELQKLAGILHAPKYKIWITPEKRRQAADALGETGSREAAPILADALGDETVRDNALLALDRLPVPTRHTATVLQGLKEYRKTVRQRFFDEYFHPERNAAMIKLVPESGKMSPQTEPESFLGAALTMARSISADKAEKIAACETRGLAPYSRKHFMENVRLLSECGAFPFWPAMEHVNYLLLKTDSIIDRIARDRAGMKPRSQPPDAPKKSRDKEEQAVSGPSDERIREFAGESVDRNTSITAPMRDVGRVIFHLVREIAARYPELDTDEIFRLLTSSVVRLKCFHCGPLPAQYTQQVLEIVRDGYEKGEVRDTELLAGAGGFATGHGPDCSGAAVEVAVDPGALSLPKGRRDGQPGEPGPTDGGGETLYNVVFDGALAEGADPDKVKDNLAALFKADRNTVEKYFSGRPKLLVKNADRARAEKYVKAFARAGAVAVIKKASG